MSQACEKCELPHAFSNTQGITSRFWCDHRVVLNSLPRGRIASYHRETCMLARGNTASILRDFFCPFATSMQPMQSHAAHLPRSNQPPTKKAQAVQRFENIAAHQETFALLAQSSPWHRVPA